MVSVKRKFKAALDMSSKRSRVAKVPSLKQEVPKPVECSLLKWRRIQVNRYLTRNPTAKGKTVQEQIYRQKPVPWPGVTVRQLNTLIRKLNSSQFPENQLVHKSSTIHHIIQDTKRPPEYSLMKQRRLQVHRFREFNQGVTGKEVKLWLTKQKPDPQPDATVKLLNRFIQRVESSFQQDLQMPKEYSILKQRRKQISNYLTIHPEAKGYSVKQWLENYDVNPQPEATVKGLNKLVARLRKKTKEKLSGSANSEFLSEEKSEVKATWASKPKDYSVPKQRSVQVNKYLDLKPRAKGKEVKLQIQNHNPDPWPEATVRGLNKLIRLLEVEQDYEKPKGYSTLKQRREQISRYLNRNPDDKGLMVKTWLQYFRRYYCYSCDECKNLRFLNCENSYCRHWTFHRFKRK